MQVTVESYDPDTGAGSVLTDSGVRYEFTAAALRGSRLRWLRPGQRMTLVLSDGGVVERLRIVTLPS